MSLKRGATKRGGKRRGYFAAASGKGKLYTYRPGDKKGRARARRKAVLQGRAMAAR